MPCLQQSGSSFQWSGGLVPQHLTNHAVAVQEGQVTRRCITVQAVSYQGADDPKASVSQLGKVDPDLQGSLPSLKA